MKPTRPALTARIAVVAVILGLITGGQIGPPVATAEEKQVGVRSWVTDLETDQRLAEQPVLSWQDGPGADGRSMIIDPTRRYQEMAGFGASMTDSSATVLGENLEADTREAVMRDLFSPEHGIGLSMLRQPMGASDLSAHGSYSYDDMPEGETDEDLSEFSIDHDRQAIIPRLLEARAINPDLTLMASPWSPPGWMKTSDSMIDGVLKPEYYDTYADYFARFLTGYADVGLPTHYVSVQNEPLYAPADYPGQHLPAEDAADFIGDHLGPAVARVSPDTQILGYDHNWDNTAYPESVFADRDASRYVPGTAWHCYGGQVEAQSLSHNSFPDRQAFLTECSGGEWQGTRAEAFEQTMASVIGVPRNWGQSVVLWNLALDENNGPNNGGCLTCRGVVTAATDGTVTKELEYWALGHASRFVRPGAVRIASSIPTVAEISNVAYENADGTQVVVAYNGSGQEQQFDIQLGDRHASTSLAAGAAATYTWDDPGPLDPADDDLGWVDLDLGDGPEGTPGGRLTQSVSPALVEEFNQIKVEDGWLGFSLPYGASLRPTGDSEELSRDGWSVTASASAAEDPPAKMIDGDAATRWSSGAGQAPGDWVAVDLGTQMSFNEIVLDAGTSSGDYVRRYQVEASDDGETWRPIARGQGATGDMSIVLPPTRARHIRIVGQSSSGSWWSIYELTLRSGEPEEQANGVDARGQRLIKEDGQLADGTTVTGLYNAARGDRAFRLGIDGLRYVYRLPARTAATFAEMP